jgi:XTP/dITP diphosphohydrolase
LVSLDNNIKNQQCKINIIKAGDKVLKILAATKNQHKLQEIRQMLDEADLDFDIEILGANDVEGFPEIIEDGSTFEENAQKKALEASNFTGLAAFADDSGLAVEALNGAPGVFSARYAGEDANDAERMAKLLKELGNNENRRAKFVCAIAVAYNGEIIETFTGEVHGVIADKPRGDQGFGYDPLFIPDGYDLTFGELGADVKSKISHRAKAVQAVRDFIEEELETLEGFELI